MRSLLFILLFFSQTNALLAQVKPLRPKSVKLPDAIENANKRKVEKAKSLLNKGELFKGEQLLVKLRNENINQSYFHEALIQVQKQILDKIAFEKPHEEDEGEYFLHDENSLLPEKNAEEVYIDNGLARSVEEKKETLQHIRLSRKEKKKLKKTLDNQEKTSENAAVLNPVEAAKAAADSANKVRQMQAAIEQDKEALDKAMSKATDDVGMIPYESYRYQLINNCRFATLKHERVDSASHYLRELLIDTVRYDTLLSEKELEDMLGAQDYYYNTDYKRAALALEKIIDGQPTYFPAHYLLAYSYYRMGLDTPCFEQFRYLTQTFPDRPEGFVGMSDYYLAKGEFTAAAAQMLKAIAIYPEDQYFVQLDVIMKRSGKVLKTQWVRREVYPISTAKNYEEIIATDDSPWRYYQQVKSLLFSYADKDGILRPNEFTTERYLEIFAWREMLSEHEILDSLIKDPKKQAAYLKEQNQKGQKKDKKKITFPFARSMDKMGFLDCYVFISLFHHDLYGGFKDFVKSNPDKVEQYFYILLNWDDKKFDQFRIKEKPVSKEKITKSGNEKSKSK